MNSVNLIGRLVEDPVARTAPDGEEQCAMRIAVPRVGDAGLREPGVLYVEVVARGLRAVDLLEQVRGGARIGVSGRLEHDEWVETDGERSSRFEVLADQLEVLDVPGAGGALVPDPA